jgi:pyruvate formate lyase activating enzyme
MIKSNKGNIHSIETLGTFDGPGVRYVIFFQGCPFQCQYCHNRDTWSTNKNNLMSVDEILTDYKKYEKFYKNGGLTASGGDPMLQADFLIELFKEAKQRGIHTVLDTAASCYHPNQNEKIKTLLKYTDLVLLDIKHIDDQQHKIITGSSNQHVLSFAKMLDDMEKTMVIRHVLVPGLSDKVEDLQRLRKFIDQLSHVKMIEILPYHRKGQIKWEQMGLEYPLKDTAEPTEEAVILAEKILKDNYNFYNK